MAVIDAAAAYPMTTQTTALDGGTVVRTRGELAALLAILVAGAILRLYAIDFGLPAQHNVDEKTFVFRALEILQTRDPNPSWFGHPGTTTIYMLAALYACIYGIGNIAGVFQSPQDFAQYIYSDPSIVFLTGRLMIAGFAVASVFLVFAIGRMVFSAWVGILGAALLAINPADIYSSQLIRTDIQLTFFVLCGVLFCVRIGKAARTTDYILAGCMLGLSVATKWPGVVLATTIFVSFLVAANWSVSGFKREFPKLVGSGVASIGAAFLASPFMFIDFSTVLSDVAHEARASHLSGATGGTGGGFLSNLWWYVWNVLGDSVTLLGLALAAVGAGIAFARQRQAALVLLSFPVLFLLFIASLSLRWERWAVPLLPFLCMCLALGIVALAVQVANLMNNRSAMLVAAFALILGAPIAYASSMQIATQAAERLNDTRTIARSWVLSNLPSGSALLIEQYGPELPFGPYRFFFIAGNGHLDVLQTSKWKSHVPNERISNMANVAEIRDRSIDYVILSGFYDRYRAERDRYPDEFNKYELMFQQTREIFRIDPVAGIRGGPPIRVLRTN